MMALATVVGMAVCGLSSSSGMASQSPTLSSLLSNAIFYNSGTVQATDQFEYVEMAVSYNEPDNVTCSMCGWAVHTPWAYEWQRIAPAPPSPAPPPPGVCNMANKTTDTDYPGNDLHSMPATTFDDCFAACCNTTACVGVLWEAHEDIAPLGQPHCWLKSSMESPRPKPPSVGAVAARVGGRSPSPTPGQPTLSQVKAPPMGYRSAPALGGVGAGSTELRSDGSFRDWTIFNQGPAGSGKYGLVDDVYMGVKVGNTARMVRTQPPAFLSDPQAAAPEALTFSGTYPLTRLAIHDTDLVAPTEVYGYSTLKPGSLAASAYPAFVLSLNVHNPTDSALNVSFMFALPFGAWTDCARPGGSAVSGNYTYVDCMSTCTTKANCSSWQYDTATRTCFHNSNVGATYHQTGSYCGVRSDAGWTLTNNGQALFRSQRPVSSNPSMGDMTLQPVASSSSPTDNADVDVDVSFNTNNDPSNMWDMFSTTGRLAPSIETGDAAHGGVALSASVPPGGNTTLSIVVAWHFPDRDFSGQILGNKYADLWTDSAHVASELSAAGKLEAVVSDINAHHAAVAHPLNPAPVWLKDQLVNQWSHFHMLMWYRDGRLREYEAWSCDDVDSVHNDYQRHLLYLWAFPEFEYNKMDAWSSFAQDADGHVWESLAYTGKPMDVGGGRLMGDTTTLYLLEMWEILLHTGNTSYVKSKWASAKNATAWMIGNAGNFSLPQYLQTTYDHFGFNRRQTVVYNCHVYLTALEAVRRMAVAIGDDTTATMVQKAISAARIKLLTPTAEGGPLWNESVGFFVAHSETQTQVFTDSLYGQMLAHHFFNGSFTINTSYIDRHLTYEWEQNQDLYGMRVLSSPIQEDSIWMNGPPTWTYLALARNQMDDDAAFEPFKRMSENFRTRLNDMWNLRALTHSETEGTELEHGQPREQGHYGFMLTDLYLLPLLSGQSVNILEGSLTLSPRYPAPYVVPLLIMNCEATITAAEGSGSGQSYRLEIAFGTLTLPAKGLVVSGCACPDALDLMAGDSKEWSCS
eukprot:m.184763 g.184763  ORF g.184763 m.184763 type:complete len:1027 (+) comp16225_c0_seq1:84-3164(+)